MVAKPTLTATLIALACWHSQAVAETRPAYGGTVKASLVGAPHTLDPARAETHAELSLMPLLFDTLYRKTDHGIEPHLATMLPVVATEGTSGTAIAVIPIRSGVLFHDGSLLTADDVARSLLRLQASRAGWLLAGVTDIVAQDHQITLTMARPLNLSEVLSAPQAAITPDGKPPSGRVVGSGPFELSTLDYHRRRVTLTAFDAHFAGRPYIDVLELSWFERARDEARRYETGRAHMSLRGQVAFSGHSPKYVTRVLESGATLLVYVGFGRGHRGLARDIELRRAVSDAIGRGGLRHIGAGEAVVPALLPLSPAAGGNIPRASARVSHPASARDHLQAAAQRWPVLARALSDRGSLTLEILVDESRPEDREVAGKLARALYRIGLSARIEEVSSRSFEQRVARGLCDLYIGHLGVPLIADAPRDPAYYEVMAAFAAGADRFAARARSAGTDELSALVAAFQKRLPIVPLYHRSIRAHIRTDVRGTAFFKSGRLGHADVFLFGDPESTRP